MEITRNKLVVSCPVPSLKNCQQRSPTGKKSFMMKDFHRASHIYQPYFWRREAVNLGSLYGKDRLINGNWRLWGEELRAGKQMTYLMIFPHVKQKCHRPLSIVVSMIIQQVNMTLSCHGIVYLCSQPNQRSVTNWNLCLRKGPVITREISLAPLKVISIFVFLSSNPLSFRLPHPPSLWRIITGYLRLDPFHHSGWFIDTCTA